MLEDDWGKERQREETEEEANSEERTRAMAGCGINSGVTVKALPFPHSITSRIMSPFSKH